jgi:anti-sigma factor RsiW
MMACAEFESLLQEYGELASDARERADAHVSDCTSCREFLEALQAVDAALAKQFAGRRVSAEFEQAVRRRVQSEPAARRPSFVPEILDFFGWGAIVALLGLALYWVSTLFPTLGGSEKVTFSFVVAWAAAFAFVLVSFLVGLRSFADLKH